MATCSIITDVSDINLVLKGIQIDLFRHGNKGALKSVWLLHIMVQILELSPVTSAQLYPVF